VPLDEMPPEPVADSQGPLQVHAVLGVAVAEVGAHQGLGTRLDLEAPPVDCHDRQAAAIDRDALADLEGIVCRQVLPGDGEADPRPSAEDPLAPTERLYQSREHSGPPPGEVVFRAVDSRRRSPDRDGPEDADDGLW